MINKQPPEQICTVCGLPMIYIDHIEYDGTEYGSSEPYFECINNCNQKESEIL